MWVLGGGDDRRLNPESVEQFVLADGSVYRTSEKHKNILTACEIYLETEAARELAGNVFSDSGALFKITREKNNWRPTPKDVLEDVEKACTEFSHGGLWCHPEGYIVDNVVSLDMSACYPGSFTGMGDCAKYFNIYGHPTHQHRRVAVNGKLPEKLHTGFAQVNS